MTIILLEHKSELLYPASHQLPLLPKNIIGSSEGSTIVSFRKPCVGSPDRVIKKLHACSRITESLCGDLILYGVETDSPLAPLILWDVAHSISIGATLLVAGDSGGASYLERDYFREAFLVERKDSYGTLFRKTSPLPAESDKGLERWSFCIPTGPGDATLLNVTVKRVLELNIPEKEILLCGRPGPGFKYWDQVRIVGEDIQGVPVQISRKKNRLAKEARYENLCILHDRVFLPKDFYRAVCEFGDYFPITTFQSIYFDDRWNFMPRRYSDVGKVVSAISDKPLGFSRDSGGVMSHFAPSALAQLEGAGFVYSSPLRYERERYYATGSLYIVKRAVWRRCPQDETIAWAEFEDIEHARRASLMGVPSRVNPNALTQSIINRPILSSGGQVTYEGFDGKVRQSSGIRKSIILPLKPLIKMSAADASGRLRQFAKKYAVDGKCWFPEYRDPSAVEWLVNFGRLIRGATFEFKEKAVREFIDDYERLVLCDQLPYGRKEYFVEQFMGHAGNAKNNLFEESVELLNFVSQRPFKAWFYRSLLDYLPTRSWQLYFGSLLSAWCLWRGRKGEVHIPHSLMWCFFAILNSTPYRDYAEV